MIIEYSIYYNKTKKTIKRVIRISMQVKNSCHFMFWIGIGVCTFIRFTSYVIQTQFYFNHIYLVLLEEKKNHLTAFVYTTCALIIVVFILIAISIHFKYY